MSAPREVKTRSAVDARVRVQHAAPSLSLKSW